MTITEQKRFKRSLIITLISVLTIPFLSMGWVLISDHFAIQENVDTVTRIDKRVTKMDDKKVDKEYFIMLKEQLNRIEDKLEKEK